MRRRRLPLLAALVLGAVGLAACGGNDEHPSGFRAVSFVDPQTGWAVRQVGETGSEIVATTDGGETWKKQLKISARLWQLEFVDRDHGWAVGEGPLLRTADGGTSWQDVFNATERAGNPAVGSIRVSFASPEVGWLVDNENHRLEKTTDGGRTWATVDSPLGEHESAIMSFVRPELGWLLVTSGGGVGFQGKALYRTDDGGQTWDMLFDSHGQLDHTPGSLGTPGYAVGLFFLNETDGWVTYGGAAAGHVALTRDGGGTWSLWRDVVRRSQLDYYWIWNLRFIDSERGYLLASRQTGDPGNLLLTSDGGSSWHEASD